METPQKTTSVNATEKISHKFKRVNKRDGKMCSRLRGDAVWIHEK